MRTEFPARVKVAAYERSRGLCESCGAALRPGRIEYDHVLPCALGGSATIENCAVLCRGCHSAKTGQGDIPRIRKADRQHAKHISARPRRPWPGADKWKKRVSGKVVPR